ncbi:MAG: ATP synthase F1 subunit delta [Chloroflexi bacterium]|nr:ATP synthase F1 subunit delta [Chloroflexota bacterium]
MAGRPTARRYAQAVFQIALENDALDQWSSDLDQIAEALGDSDFFAFLEAPQVPERVKLQGIDTVLVGVSGLARNLVGVLVDHRSVRFAVNVRDQYGALLDRHRGVARATVTTALPLTDEQRGRVRDLLGELVGAKVDATEDVDPQIVGGIIARVGDHLIDGSVTTKLRNMKNALARPPAQLKRD